MVRIAKPSDPERIEELKQKIHNETYLNLAIMNLAQVLSSEILQQKEDS